MTHRGRAHRTIRSALAHGVVLGVALATLGAALWVVPAPAHARTAHPARTGPACAPVDSPFRPTTLTIAGVLAPAKVLALGEDAYGVPEPPPLTSRGKWQLAWDKEVGVRPGDSSGVVRLTAHTYPGAGTPALGNLLLERLETGAQLELSGSGGERLCYRVTRRQQVRATASLSGYYDTTGRPRLAILVCSGKRLGPGSWTHRTVWYAEPSAVANEQPRKLPTRPSRRG